MMMFVSLPFWLIGFLFLFAGGGAMLAAVHAFEDRRDMMVGPPAQFFIWCMLIGGGFFYFAGFLATRGL